MKKITLYQLDTQNRVRVWTIEVIDNGNSSTIKSVRGLEDGKMVDDLLTISEGKNVGKANETNHYTQAVSEAKSRIKAKIKEGYVEDRNNMKPSDVLGSGIKSPMLAQKFDDTKKQKGSKDLNDLNLDGKLIFVQRKKDGNRCLIIVNKQGAKMYTRKGDLLPLLPHITDSICDNFAKIFDYVNEKYGVEEYILDGELFTKEFSFNKLNGLVKKQTRTPEEMQLLEKIKYHIYDVDIEAGYETRMKIINYFKSSSVHVEETEEILATPSNIKAKLQEYLAEGEEGLMIRVPGKPYENKRSWSLLKVKIFEDSEFRVIGFDEDKRGGMLGAVICEMDVEAKDRNGNPIETFKAGLSKISHEEAVEFWKNRDKYMGMTATIEYFERSEYNVPRFPKFKGFRDDVSLPKKADKKTEPKSTVHKLF